MRQASELSGVTSKDWDEGKVVASELASTAKPLPSRPYDKKPTGIHEFQELEGEIEQYHAEKTVMEEDRKTRIRAHFNTRVVVWESTWTAVSYIISR